MPRMLIVVYLLMSPRLLAFDDFVFLTSADLNTICDADVLPLGVGKENVSH